MQWASRQLEKPGTSVGTSTCAAWTTVEKVSSTESGARIDELDLQTLVCTRGRDFPLAQIAEMLRCPRCGCRRVAVMFGPPTNSEVGKAAVAQSYRWRAIDED
jgi:hypothetical protein